MFNIKYFLLSFGMTTALLFNFDKELGFEYALENSVMSNGVLVYLLFFLIYLFLNKTEHITKKNHLSWIQWLISLFLAGIQLSKRALEQTDSLSIIFSSLGYLILSIVVFSSFVVFFNYIQIIIMDITERNSQLSEEKSSRIFGLPKHHPMLLTIFVLLICWLPSIIINYPSILPVDAFRQLSQYYGEIPIKNSHPPIHTIMFGSAVSLGRKLGSANLGLFISNIPQISITAFAFGLATTVLNKLKVPVWLMWFNIVLGALSPAVIGLLMVSTKDLLFTSTVLILYCLYVLYLMSKDNLEKESFRSKILLAVAIFMVTTFVILLRKNGIYMVLPVILFVLIDVLKNMYRCIRNNEISFRNSIKIIVPIIIVLAPLMVAQEVEEALMEKYNIVDHVRKSEMLSIPFQQTARYVKEYPNEVSVKEKNAIENVLAYDKLAELYTPHVSDKVKRTHPLEVSDDEYKEYFEVWWSMFKKHPRIYLESTLSQNYYLFSPENLNSYYGHLENGIEKKEGQEEQKSFIEIKEKIGIKPTYDKIELQDKLLKIYKSVDSLPITSIFSNFSLFVIIIIIIMGMSYKMKCFNTLKLSIPIFVLLGTIFAGPIIRGYLRYGAPFIYITPILFGYLLFELRTQKNNRIV